MSGNLLTYRETYFPPANTTILPAAAAPIAKRATLRLPVAVQRPVDTS